MKKTGNMAVSIIIALIMLLVAGVLIFIKVNPAFGQSPTKEQKKALEHLPNYANGKFQNIHSSDYDLDYWGLFKKSIQKSPNRAPSGAFDIKKMDSSAIVKREAARTQITWFGHSAFLLEMDGRLILLDPMFGERASPVSFIGSKRYSDIPIETEELPEIDMVIFSHDHYDHLDYTTIKKLHEKVGRFYVPLGLGNHLRYWGVPTQKIVELNWWDKVTDDQLQLVCTPARHFSGRSITDNAATLWASWVIKGENHKIYFSGDGGYDIHFKEIGEKYGPFDLALLECGQYNEDWKYLHMMPEETAMAAMDLNTKLAMPIHWGAFTLAFHDWHEPVVRMLRKAAELQVPVATPEIGQPLIVGGDDYLTSRWWENYLAE